MNPAGDVDGDGLDDLFVGATANSDGGSDAGKSYLILGSTLAASTATTLDLSDADFAFIGERWSDYAGRSVSTAGDLDGDGLDDLLVGAYFAGDVGARRGKAYVILGRTLAASTSTSLDLFDADFHLTGEEDQDFAGVSVSTAGDVDGDGLDDLIIGSYGKAYVVLSQL